MFNPMSGGKEPVFWQQILLVAIPAFVGACLPPIISHHLEVRRARHGSNGTAHAPKSGDKKRATKEKQ